MALVSTHMSLAQLSTDDQKELKHIDEGLRALDPFSYIASALNPLLETHEAPPPRPSKPQPNATTQPNSASGPALNLIPNPTPKLGPPPSTAKKSQRSTGGYSPT